MTPFGKQCVRCGMDTGTQSDRCPGCNRRLDRILLAASEAGLNARELGEEFGLSWDAVSVRLSRTRRAQRSNSRKAATP